jgi:hypothetical protein
MLSRVDEAFQQQGLEAPVFEPVAARTTRDLSEHMTGQMRHPDVREDQEAAVVEHSGQVLAPGLSGPADPVVAHGHRPGGTRQQDATEPQLTRRDEVAQPVAEGALETERVPARHQIIPLPRQGGVTDHFQADRGKGRQRSRHR